MKRIIVFFMTLLVTSSLYSQSKVFGFLPNSNNNTVEIFGTTDLEEGQFKMAPNNLYTDRGSIRADNMMLLLVSGAAPRVFFLYTIIDDKLTIMSGTESNTEIVKAYSSKTTFNSTDATSIEIHVGDVFIVWNAALMYECIFQVISYDEETQEITLKNGFSLTNFACSDENCVIPDAVYFNNEKYTVTEIAQRCFAGCSNLTSITIPNTITKVGEHAFSGCTSLTSITIHGTVESIGVGTFLNCSSLTSITIPESVESIGENAFEGCTKLTKVTCMSSTPPKVNSNSFANYNSYLYVPCESKETYDLDAVWGNFKHIECIGSETVELTNDEVVVEPDKTEAVFSMPVNESANSYTLTISNNGVTFCTLTFNAQGQLSNIDFSTTKSYELKAGVSGYQFTVTGLSEATNYGYSFKALASNKSVLKEYAGSFTTKNADGTGGSVQGGGEGTLAVDNVSVSNAITISNSKIIINGEAPAFVVTVSGQKIANANLKAGVYFVVAEGETVKVVVR